MKQVKHGTFAYGICSKCGHKGSDHATTWLCHNTLCPDYSGLTGSELDKSPGYCVEHMRFAYQNSVLRNKREGKILS
jgi:hypothetical protein